MSEPIRILSNNYIQTKESGLAETQSGTIRQAPSQLKTMAPTNMPIDGILRGNMSLSNSSSETCRNYSGLKGLRQLKTEQKELSGGQPKCGWMYKPSGGVNPLVSRGAFGSVGGPIDGAPGRNDDVSNGIKWYADLNQAEMDISTALCSSIQSCDELGKLGAQAEFVGYCKTTGAIIPVTRNSKGSIQARYKKNGLGCEKKDIVTSQNLNKCPKDEGFNSGSQSLHSTHVRKEGFLSEGGDDADDDDGDDADICDTIPIPRKCVIQAAEFAGCSNTGTLIHSLQQGDSTGKQGYNSILRAKPSFQAYQALMNPRLNDAVLKDGSATQQVAIDSFSYLPQATSSTNTKLRLAATDLCVKEGAYDAYDFCTEMTSTTTITPSHLKCLDGMWKAYGGTKMGTAYVSLLKKYQGQQWGIFLNAMETYRDAMKTSYEVTYENQGAQKQRHEMIREFIGLDQVESKKIDLNTSSSRAIECIWAKSDQSEKECIVLGEQIRYASSGTLYPRIREGNDLRGLIGITRNFSLTVLQEPRTTQTGDVGGFVQSDGITGISHTVNGFVHESRSGVDHLVTRGSWKTPSNTQPYTIQGNQKKNMVFITEVESLAPSPSFSINDLNSNNGANLSKFAHLPQEANAPWLQIEVCDRSSFSGKRQTTLQDTRLTTREFQFPVKNITPIINSQSKMEVPGEKYYAKFTSDSTWRSLSRFAFSGFRTITVLFRPTATPSEGEQQHLFSHAYRPRVNTYVYGYYSSLITSSGKQFLKSELYSAEGKYYTWYIHYKPNEWNMLILQYIQPAETESGTFQKVMGVATSCYTLKDLQNTEKQSSIVSEIQRTNSSNRSSTVFYPPVGDGNEEQNRWSGQLFLGKLDFLNVPSFTGDVAWVHGYRAAFDTKSMLEKEVNQTWKSSWIQPNIL